MIRASPSRPRRQAGRERYEHGSPDEAREPGDHQRGGVAHGGLLEHDPDGVRNGSDEAEDDAESCVGPGRPRGRRETDHRRAGECHERAIDQARRETLGEEETAEDRDEDRADVDEHRGRTRVDVSLAGVQDHVVEGEPENPRRDDEGQRRGGSGAAVA